MVKIRRLGETVKMDEVEITLAIVVMVTEAVILGFTISVYNHCEQ